MEALGHESSIDPKHQILYQFPLFFMILDPPLFLFQEQDAVG